MALFVYQNQALHILNCVPFTEHSEQYCHRCIQVEIQAIHIRMEDFLEYHLPGIQKYLNKNINWVNLLCKIKFYMYNQHCGSAKFWCGSAFEITDSDPLKDRCGSGSRSRCQWMIFVSIISLTLGFPSIYFRCWKEVLVLCNIFYIYWLKNGKKKYFFFWLFLSYSDPFRIRFHLQINIKINSVDRELLEQEVVLNFNFFDVNPLKLHPPFPFMMFKY